MMSNRINLSTWVQQKHADQVIKHTNQLYFQHLLNVASRADGKTPLGYEIGLCHDLLEDTDVTKEEFKQALVDFGYEEDDVTDIVNSVIELTDVFIKKDFPYLNNKERKILEAKRLVTISARAQTVKYADLYDNIAWMEVHDRKQLRNYLTKKLKLVKNLDKGEFRLHQQVITRIQELLVSQR